MAKKVQTQEDLKAINALLLEQAKQQAAVSNSLEDYLKGLDKAKKINQTIIDNQKIEVEVIKEFRKARANNDRKEAEHQLKILKILRQETKEHQDQLNILGAKLKAVNKTNLVMGKMLASAVKGFGKLPNLIDNAYGRLKGSGLFEMDKAIKTSALEMGLLGKQSLSYQSTIREASLITNDLGIGVAELAKMQSTYSEELGRTVILGQKGLVAMSEMAAATGLGAEGTAKMAADMETQGYSAERTSKYVEQTLNDASKMGINASKVIKNIQGNIKMLNKYNFKDGAKGLAKMAATVSKLGVDMNFAAGMADKLFDIEGAVDMSAQLQVMGGEWAKLADPFKLMYMARNDMEGLTEALGQAAASSAHFNEKTGEFEISALEMHRLRKIAEQTGVAYEDLAQAGKNAAKFSKIKSQVSFDMSDEAKEFITNTAQFENGKAYIEVDGEKKFINELGASGKNLIEAQMKENKTLAERAKASQTFDDKLTNLMNMVKTTMLPIVDGLSSVLGPLVDDLLKDDGFKKQLKELGVFIGKGVEFGAGIIKSVAEFALWLGPKGTLATLLGGKILFEAASWIANGFALAKGFKLGTEGLSSLLGSATGGIANKGSGIKGGMAGGSALKGLGMAGGLGIAGMGIGALTDATTDPGSAMNILGKAAADGMTGAAIGSFLGPIGAAIGGVIGATYGGITAYNSKPESAHDAIFNSPIHDGIGKGLGSDFSKDRGIIQGGKITPIDNKDNLIAMKPKGPIDNAMKDNSSKTMKIEFGEIHFKFDELKVTSPGNPGVAIDLLKDSTFIRDITRMVHSETEKVIQGGKNKG